MKLVVEFQIMALDSLTYMEASKEEVAEIFEKALKGETLSFDEESKY